jgi:hypothetical protein
MAAMLFRDASWAQINAFREQIASAPAGSVEGAAQSFVAALTDTFESVVLARLFVVLPFEKLQPVDREFAKRLAGGDARLTPATPCLSLLATRGREPSWNDRTQSRAHRAIPLIDHAFVRSAPMLAKLLADLEVDLRGLDVGQPIEVRRMLGAHNGTFYVPDAQSACDSQGRLIIADREFVAKHAVRTVFGMGGAYANETLVIAIVFTTELLERLIVDRYPSLISNFKMGTASLLERAQIYES